MKKLTLLTLAIIALASTLIGTWLYTLDQDIARRFAEKRFAPPVEFYSAGEHVAAGATLAPTYLTALFERKHFRKRDFGQALQEGDYSIWAASECRGLIPALPDTLISCVAFHNSGPVLGAPANEIQLLAFDQTGLVLGVWAGSPLQVVQSAALEAELFAQYYGDKPTLRRVVTLGDTPANCLQALLAIEDAHFLEHGGVSVTGLLRAFFKNLRSGRVEQGGSTITQQLVKNYFLSQERTLKRKIRELVMALLVEGRVSKDDILETYINLIYLGQNGPFEIRGFGAAADHYFATDLRDLNLPQCALLTAMIASPGQFNPFIHPDKATQRRSKVLDRMLELKWITQDQAVEANAAPLPLPPRRLLTEPAPYFVQAVRQELDAENIDSSGGLKVFTTLNLRAQEAAHHAVSDGLTHLETTVPLLKKLKAQGKNLEAVLVSADPLTGEIQAVVGGRSFVSTQFNRAIEGHRQVGSIMKPFVYLAALESNGENGKPYTPLTLLNDAPFTHAYQGQSWSPKNYNNKYFGEVPMFFALKESLNAATAVLGLSVGLPAIIDVARRAGISSRIEPFPALTLGAFELYPREVLQAYATLARLGQRTPLYFIERVEDALGHKLQEHEAKVETSFDPNTAAVLVGMMRQTVLTGSARFVSLSGFTHPAAGKTGTTNDKKDAWFGGFTPHHVAVVWVGYDDNTPHELTGASGAVPIWTHYMKEYGTSYPANEFTWPEGTELRSISTEDLKAMNVENAGPVQLVFKKSQ